MKKVLVAIFILCWSAVVYAQQCNQSVVINVAAATTGELVAGESGRSVGVCGFVVSADTAATGAQFQVGTGTTCGTGNSNKTGVMRMAVNASIVQGGGTGELFSGAAGQAVCLAATTGAVTGILTYRVRN